MDSHLLAWVGLGVGLLNLILALVTLGAVARFWLKHHRSGLSAAWWILALGFAAFAIAQTLEFRRLLITTEPLAGLGAEIAARFAFVCVVSIGLWRLFEDVLKTKQRSLEEAETAVRLVRLESEAMRQGHAIQLLRKISQLMLGAPDLPAALEALCRATRDIMKSAFVSVRLLQPMPDGFRAALDADPELKLDPETPGSRLEGLWGRVARTGKPAVEAASTQILAGADGRSPFASLAGFPVLRGKEVLGVLTIGYQTSHALATDEELLAAAVADHAATALVNAQQLEQARQSARTDSLTGLANRCHFDELLEAETRRAVRYHTLLSLLLFEVDNLKAGNDTFGQAAGDACLATFARHLAARSRSADVVARFGGDQFAVLMTHTAPSGARQAAERFRQIFRSLTFEWEGRKLDLSISIGCAGWGAGEATQSEALIAAAYQSLSADKLARRQQSVASSR